MHAFFLLVIAIFNKFSFEKLHLKLNINKDLRTTIRIIITYIQCNHLVLTSGEFKPSYTQHLCANQFSFTTSVPNSSNKTSVPHSS